MSGERSPAARVKREDGDDGRNARHRNPSPPDRHRGSGRDVPDVKREPDDEGARSRWGNSDASALYAKAGGDMKYERREGDWTCPRCRANVYASKNECFRCREPHPDGPGRVKREEGAGAKSRNIFDPPPVCAVLRGTVRRVTDFGAFVELEGFPGKWGLCHFSQIRHVPPGGERIEVADELVVDQQVWVKVVAVDVEQQKIGLSMKYADQESGTDLDPMHVAYEKDKQSEESRRQGGGRGGGSAFDRGKREEMEYAQHEWGKKAGGEADGEDENAPKEEKSFALSGLLAKETRMVPLVIAAVVLLSRFLRHTHRPPPHTLTQTQTSGMVSNSSSWSLRKQGCLIKSGACTNSKMTSRLRSSTCTAPLAFFLVRVQQCTPICVCVAAYACTHKSMQSHPRVDTVVWHGVIHARPDTAIIVAVKVEVRGKRLTCLDACIGRDRHLHKLPGYIATDHPSCSKQHAVIQFRLHEKDDGAGGFILKVSAANGRRCWCLHVPRCNACGAPNVTAGMLGVTNKGRTACRLSHT